MLQKTMVIFLMVLFLPSVKVTDPYIYHPDAPTVSEYNRQRYEAYAGEPQEPLVITYTDEPQEPLVITHVEYTDEEIALMARVVMSEASLLPFDAKEAIAQTIINRVLLDDYSDSVVEVIYEDDQYSTADNGEVTEECFEAVKAAIEYKPFPMSMYYFRQDHYHSFGYPYTKIGNTYFSTKEKLE